MKAYRQGFDAIAALIIDGDAGNFSGMSLGDITTEAMRAAFARYAETHEAPSIQRCWSTWAAVHRGDPVRPPRPPNHLRPVGCRPHRVPLLAYFAIMWAGGYAFGIVLRLGCARTTTLAFTAASNTFELAIAVAVATRPDVTGW